MFEKNYFTTGEFAKICNIEKHVLFHYDQIGLFQPAIVKENGYRYYSYRQYDMFCMIGVLKDLGMSLKDIKVYLEQREPQRFLQLLKEKEYDLQKEIKKLERTRAYIQTMHRGIEDALQADKTGIQLLQLPKEYLLCSRNPCLPLGNSFKDYTKEYVNFYHTNQFAQVENIGTMLQINQLKEDEFADFASLYTKSKSRRGDSIYIRKAGTFLSTYHYGSYEKIQHSYHRLLDYAQENNIELGDFAFEEYVINDIAQKDSEEYVTLILMETKTS